MSPLTAGDMVHTAQNPKFFSGTKRLIEKGIKNFGLNWLDVEEVAPTYDFIQVLAQSYTIDSWNIKMAIVPSKKTDVKVRSLFHPQTILLIVLVATVCHQSRAEKQSPACVLLCLG